MPACTADPDHTPFVAQLIDFYVLSPNGDLGEHIQVIKGGCEDDSTDRGFTLIETIVVVLMVAVLASVIVAGHRRHPPQCAHDRGRGPTTRARISA